MAHAFNPSTQEASLVYKANARLSSKATEKNPVLKSRKRKKILNVKEGEALRKCSKVSSKYFARN